MGIGHRLLTAIPIGIGFQNTDPELHGPAGHTVADGHQNDGGTRCVARHLAGGGHCCHSRIQAEIANGIGTVHYSIIQGHRIGRTGQQIEVLGHSIVLAQVVASAGVLLDGHRVGLALNYKGVAHTDHRTAPDGTGGSDILKSQLLQACETHTVNITGLVHKEGMPTAGGAGCTQHCRCHLTAGAGGVVAQLAVSIVAHSDQAVGIDGTADRSRSHQRHADTAADAGHLFTLAERQVIALAAAQRHIQLYRSENLSGIVHHVSKGRTVLRTVETPAIDVAGIGTHLHGRPVISLIHPECNGHGILPAGAHGQRPALQLDAALDLVLAILTDAQSVLAIIAHGLNRAIGLEDICCCAIAGAEAGCHVAYPIQNLRQTILFGSGVASQLLGSVITHTVNIVAQHAVGDQLPVLIDPAIVHALDHQGKSMSIVHTAYGDVHDLLNIIFLTLGRFRTVLLLALKHLRRQSHSDRSILAQAQLTTVVPAPGPDSAVILQSVDKVAGSRQLTDIVQVLAILLLNLLRVSICAINLADTQLAVLVGTPGPNGAVTSQSRSKAGASHHLRIGHAVVALGGQRGIVKALIHAAALGPVSVRSTNDAHLAAGGPDFHLQAGHGQRILGQRQDHIGGAGVEAGKGGQLVIIIVHPGIVVLRNVVDPAQSRAGVVPHRPGQILLSHAVLSVIEDVEGGNLGRDLEAEALSLGDGDGVILHNEVGSTHSDRLIGGVGGGITQAAIQVLAVGPQGAVRLHDQRMTVFGGGRVHHGKHVLDMVAVITGSTGRDHIGHTGNRRHGGAILIAHVAALAQTGSPEHTNLRLVTLGVSGAFDDLVIVSITHRPHRVVGVRDLQILGNVNRHGESQSPFPLHHVLQIVGIGLIHGVGSANRQALKGSGTVIDMDGAGTAILILYDHSNIAVSISGLSNVLIQCRIARLLRAAPGLDFTGGGDGHSIVDTAADRQSTTVKNGPVRLLLIGVTTISMVADIAPGNDLSIGTQDTHVGRDLIGGQLDSAAENPVIAQISR